MIVLGLVQVVCAESLVWEALEEYTGTFSEWSLR